MLPLLLKFLPIGGLLKFLFYIAFFGVVIGFTVIAASQAGLAQPEAPDPSDVLNQTEEEPSEWDSITEEFSNLRVHAVKYNEKKGVAEIYLSVPSDGETVSGIVLTDGTRTETGFANRMTVEVEPGEQVVYELELWNVDNEHISIEAEGRLWLHFGQDSDLRYKDDADYAIILGPISIVLGLVMLVGLSYYSKRNRYEAINPLS